MKIDETHVSGSHPVQQAIREKCFHRSGEFVPFPTEDVDTSIPERFEKIVEQYPERIAVQAGNQLVNYAELNAMANRIAHSIVRDQGSDAEPVALFFEKGIPLVAAMLGVLKAGKFFVLLDVSFPMSRIATTLDDSQARLIISGKVNFDLTHLAATSSRRVIEFASIDSVLSTQNLRLPITPTALGYVIYTSGSTGKPKGVAKSHENQLHTVMLRTNANHICVQDKIALLPSGTANAVANIFLALLNGAALLPFDINEKGVPSLAAWLSAEQISICQIATPLFRRLCEVLNGNEDFSALRILRMRSESVQKSDFALYKKYFPPPCLFLNGLSTSETSVVTEYLTDQSSVITGDDIPVGFEMDGIEVLLLDEHGRHIGANQVGEMVIRSKYLSPGYWKNPELTAGKFKNDLHDPSKRLYFTGDLGMKRPDGCLIYKGRKDFRVKVRGYGVELAEIEKAFGSHPAIKDAIALAPQSESGETRLVAYFTSHRDPAPSVSELHSYLKEKLPVYMVPSAFVHLDALPLTPNGKVDRQLLPKPDSLRPKLDNPYVAPATAVEKKLASIWAEVLSLVRVGIHDNFFDLGGHSLAVTRVVSQVIRHCRLEIPIQYFFHNPTVSLLADYIEKACQTPTSTSDLAVRPVPRNGRLPLSFSQERLWFLDQLEPGGHGYNVMAAYHLKGTLNSEGLERSVNEIIKRHEVLRTVFRSVDGAPEQIILPAVDVTIPLSDLRHCVSQDQKHSEVRRLFKEEAQRPFDLTCGPLLRISLLRLADDEYLLCRAMHHIVIDGWSGSVLFRELAQFYEAFSESKTLTNSTLPIQYADFAAWQRQWLQGEVLEAHLSYWRKNLESVPTLQLATDRLRPAIQTSHGAHESFVLSETLSAGLKSLSLRHGVTLFMTLLAAFQSLLARYTGQTDVVIGSPVAGRNRGEFEPLIGFFLNMLALRTDLSGNPTFRELLQRTREVCLGALAHQDMPFEKLIEELHTKRDLSHHPLFQVTFGFRNTPRFSIELAGIKAEEIDLDSGIARFDMNLFMEEMETDLRGYINYNTDLFNADTIRRFIGHLKNLLESVVDEPEQRLSQLSILSEAEKNQLLVERNDTGREDPGAKCIHRMIEIQVEKSPDAVAVVFDNQQLTYSELDRRANQLANYLKKQGVGSETLVGICLERSLDLVVGLLGVLKAGGAYLPIDPDCPRDRIEFMLQDSQASFLVTQASIEKFMPSVAGQRIDLDSHRQEIARESTANVGHEPKPDGLAYVIYTSGSTGKPKGVAIQHGSVVNFLASMAREPGMSKTDVLLAVTTVAFDIAGLEIYLPLTVGARVVLARREVVVDAIRLAEQLSDSGTTVMQATPATWQMLLAVGWQGNQKLKILCGGETLSEGLAKALVGRCATLWNLYGPTETTIWSAVQKVDANSDKVVLGRPISNTQIYIFDPYLQAVPVGVPGELYISGAGLARGYINQPEFTAEKFVIHSVSGEPTDRLFKSGDLARYLPDGNIEFLGRLDNQVKVRGYRIELGEIESVLDQHRAIQTSVVAVLEDEPGDQRLVGYVIARPEESIDAAEVRNYLKQKLPDFMIPSALIQLDELPLTPSGKVNRKALPAPDQSRPEMGENHFVPRTPVEEILATIWAGILKLDKVGIHDNFFDLGGHSLLATQVISRINNAFSIDVQLRRLFETPTIAGLAALIDASLAAKNDTQSIPPMVPRARTGDAPLSFAQQRLWFLDQLDPNSATYNVPAAIRLVGELDACVLEQSFNEIVRRHEALRTVFTTVDGEPAQTVLSPAPVDLTCVDVSDRPQNECESILPDLVREEAAKPFDLCRGPLLRIKLLRLAPQDHVLCLNMHHVVSDGWSIGVLFRELSELYHAYGSGKPSSLPELPVQYADYSVWQRQWLQREELDRQLSYWRKQLDGISPLQLPTDRTRPSVQTYRGCRATFELSVPMCQALKALSQQQGVTLFMTLLASFQLLLSRYCGQTDIAVGTPIAGRTRQETEGLIGFFVNTLVLRVDLSANPTFTELLRQVREATLDAYTHQDLPFEKLVEELHPERNLSYSPLFQVLFAFQNNADQPLEFEGLTVQPIRTASDIAKFDLTLTLSERSGTLAGSLNYNTDLFNASTIERMVGHFRNLLEGIVADPEQRISELPLLSEAEKYQLLFEWNDTQKEYPRDKCIHELFEEQVEKTPDAVAVVFEGQHLAYRELNERANQLAHYLKKSGIGPETLVALCVDRSLEMIVGLLGILKAGGAYLPLDPSYPAERLAFMLQDSQSRVLLTERKFLSSIDHQSVVCLDRDWQEIAKENVKGPQNQATNENLAYVVYTSGSTGTPKGVMITHRGLVNYLCWATEAYKVAAGNGAPLHSSIGFDLSITSIFTPLLAGRRVMILPEDHGVEALSSLLHREKNFSLIKITPAHLEVLSQELPADKLAQCGRALIIGGEALTFDKLTVWSEHAPATRLINEYGPTETVVGCCVYEVAPGIHCAGAVPIGRPIANTQLFILDRHLQPAPIGIAGELHIGGDGLARGYLNRPELTKEKFIVNPFSANPMSRLYKTGDLARYLPDGNIEFIGRIDNQVKIRGYRIELGEIESLLCQHPDVRTVLVLVQEDNPGDRRLVAYVVAARGCALSVNELRNLLQRKLPEYMVPSAFVFLNELPLSPNGKLDRKALLAPDQSRPELGENYFVPRTPVEEILATIWAMILKLDKVGIHDNFFQLGGHSLLATQVISRVSDAFAIGLPVRRLFEAPTIAELAVSIDANLAAKNDTQSIPPIVPRARTCDAPLSFAQQRLWFLDRLDPDSATYNVPAAFRIEGALNVRALEQSLTEVIKRHEALRTIFPTSQGEPVQTILPPSAISLEHTDLSRQSQKDREQEVNNLLQQNAERPFDLEHGPLLRSRLIRLAFQKHVLLLSMHHIVSDGWSMGVLFRELSELYISYVSGTPTSLPELTIHYGDYTVWQREWLQGEALNRQLSYWRKQLDGVSTLQLPTDRPRPALQTYRGSRATFELSVPLFEALKSLSKRQGVTLFMTLLASFQLLLSRYCGQSDIAVGSPIAGRTRQEIEGLIGFFVNTLVLRADLSANPTFTELLRQVRETTLDAYTHQDLPFEKLVEELHPERNLSYSPLFQVMFAFQNNTDQPLEFEGLSVQPIRAESHIAKFDLMLTLSEKNGTLGGSLNYNTDLFDAATMNRMVGHFMNLLEGMVANPEQQIGELPLLSEAEKHQLLVEWNDTKRDYPTDKYVHELFEEQVERTPDAVAVIFEGQQLTYRELNQRANQLAHYMIAQGIHAETHVAVCLERSIELAIGFLAILKAGGVYLPLDPTYPRERLMLMVQDSRAQFIVSVGSMAAKISSQGAQSIFLDMARQQIDQQDHSNPRSTIVSDNPAYVLYTSGSTGIPKGVVMGHVALRNLVSWQVENFSEPLLARTLQFASLGFDVSIQEMLATWCTGGSLSLIKEELRRDSLDLLRMLEEQSIERVFLPFVALQHMADAAAYGNCFPQNLREIITAGEQLQLTESLRSFLNRLGNCSLHNQYGPTESHVVTEFTLKPPFNRWPNLPPIGRPIANAQLYILDQYLAPVPIGVVGDLYIGGAGLARGYLNRPELTAEKFIANPFSNEPQARLYKTSDLARYLPDGNIEFLGRIDNQVKIRGYRIELGEIETALGQLPSIRESVVLAREDSPGDRRLVAYVVAAPGFAPSVNELRNLLQRKLPEYMVPSAFVFLEEMPLNSNGKLDRKALPPPDQDRRELANVYQRPRTPTEQSLTAIWREVLKLVKVGMHDNFFDLGGHSLLATQVVSRIRSAFSIEFPLRTLFESPTVAEMASIITQSQAKRASDAELAQMLSEVEAMTEEEAQKLFARTSAQSSKGNQRE